ncbi:hypothetical protein VNO78_20647 [Psophocarpus tetragonolobus]|uniref:Uncharacterized protein n=1 Tax=Psophocarpus tetragonolobus TaxID=3891 RepID=A0AAN9SF03_PSOTE
MYCSSFKRQIGGADKPQPQRNQCEDLFGKDSLLIVFIFVRITMKVLLPNLKLALKFLTLMCPYHLLYRCLRPPLWPSKNGKGNGRISWLWSSLKIDYVLKKEGTS